VTVPAGAAKVTLSWGGDATGGGIANIVVTNAATPTASDTFSLGRKKTAGMPFHDEGSQRTKKLKITVPWFIGLFLLSSLMRSYVPAISIWSLQISEVAHRGMILVLFLIGSSLSLRALRVVGWRTMIVGLALWIFISTTSLLAILFFKLAT
jgi:hypothetical protein